MDMKNNTINATGKCLCGKVTIEAKAMSTDAAICHCSMCRKWSAGPFVAVHGGKEVSFIGESNITRFDSSDWAQRGFCANCGTHLFYYLKPTEEYELCAELFDASAKLTLTQQIFIDEKPSYYSFANDTKNLTGKEVFELYTNDKED